MAIDLEIVTRAWLNPDGSYPDGSVTFQLSAPEGAAAEDTTVVSGPVIAVLVEGAISQQLVPNVNSDLTPNGTFYWVTENVVGATPREYPITVPTGGPFDLWTLEQQS